MEPVSSGFSFWQALQIFIVVLIIAWFFRTLRMPTKFSQRQQERREQRLERRRHQISADANSESGKSSPPKS